MRPGAGRFTRCSLRSATGQEFPGSAEFGAKSLLTLLRGPYDYPYGSSAIAVMVAASCIGLSAGITLLASCDQFHQ